MFFTTLARARGNRYSFKIKPSCFKMASPKIKRIINFNFSKSFSIKTLSMTSFTIRVSPDKLAASIKLPISEKKSKTR